LDTDEEDLLEEDANTQDEGKAFGWVNSVKKRKLPKENYQFTIQAGSTTPFSLWL
jgi:hypothetical protein